MDGKRGEETPENESYRVLESYGTIAVVGLSRSPGKDSHRVASYLKERGYVIVPINPVAEEILGERCFKSLLDVPEDLQKEVEVVDVFRPSEDVPPIVEQAIQLRRKHGKPHVIWMQVGIVNERAAELAREAGLTVIMDKCMMIEHQRLTASKRRPASRGG
ncbi:MAG: CoA-binding protein [Candidatus Geothermarchaeales archaeon]